MAAYYVVSEALTNAAKYANASPSTSRWMRDDGCAPLHVAVRDDGRGGADPEHGSGLLGLKDRVEAIGGSNLPRQPSTAQEHRYASSCRSTPTTRKGAQRQRAMSAG